MKPIEIAKRALTEIMRCGHVGAQTVALEALTEIAIEEDHARQTQEATRAIVNRMFKRTHG